MAEISKRFDNQQLADALASGQDEIIFEFDIVANDLFEAQTLLPPKGSPIAVGDPRIVRRRLIKSVGFGFFRATITWSSAPFGLTGEEEDIDDPLQQPAIWTVRHGYIQVETDKDRDGNIIRNTAGQPFSSSATDELLVRYYSATQWEAGYNVNQLIGLFGKLNNATWFGHDAETVRFLGKAPTMPVAFSGGIVQIQYDFEWRPDGWQKNIFNRGTMAYPPGGSKAVPIIIDGQAITSEVFLSPPGASQGEYDPDNPPAPNSLSFDIIPVGDFSTIPIRT